MKGNLHDKSLNPDNPEENGSLGVRAAIDCLNITTKKTIIIAIATGNIIGGEEYVGKYGLFTAVKKYPNGTGYNMGCGHLTIDHITKAVANCTDAG